MAWTSHEAAWPNGSNFRHEVPLFEWQANHGAVLRAAKHDRWTAAFGLVQATNYSILKRDAFDEPKSVL
jgi:hypothetical protein